MTNLADRLRRSRDTGIWRIPAFRLLVTGQFTSSIGDAFYAIALPWLILGQGGGSAELGVVVAAYGVARAVGIPAGGALADRLGPRPVMAVADTVRFVVSTVLGVLAVAGHTPLWVLIPAAVLHGGCGGAFLPASRAIMPSLLDEKFLPTANSVYTALTQTGALLGPAVGGVVVALTGSGLALIVDGVTFAVSAATLLALRPAVPAAGAAGPGERSPGFAAVLRHGRLLHALLAAAFVLNLVFAGTLQVALPALAHDDFGAAGYGGILLGFSLGALGGAFLTRLRWAADRPMMRVLAYTVVMGLALAALPYAGGVAGAVVCMAVVGAGDAATGIELVSTLQVWAPAQVLGRVMSVLMFGVMGLAPVSVLIAGVVVNAFGPRLFFPLAGGATIAAMVVALAVPAFRCHRAGDRFVAPAVSPPEPAEASGAAAS
ncbi:MFS transporter [Micromonospora sp. NPDC048999]|uniref:MFS transporter n=1 Tax=Micromonospora sp. NPDC048999 TaxID=3155391 RepID=UPI0033D979C2